MWREAGMEWERRRRKKLNWKQIPGPGEGLCCKRPIQCLASSEILTLHPLTARRVCIPPPRLWCWERTYSLEDARHCSVLYTSKYFVPHSLTASLPKWLLSDTVLGGGVWFNCSFFMRIIKKIRNKFPLMKFQKYVIKQIVQYIHTAFVIWRQN